MVSQWRLGSPQPPALRSSAEKRGREATPSAAIVASQSVKTTESGGARGFDAFKMIKGRKRHLLVDSAGNVLAVLVTAADALDRDALEQLLARCHPYLTRLQLIWADGAYQSAAWIKKIAEKYKIVIEVVTRAPEQKGFVVLPRRWVVERSIAWINRARRLSKDFEGSIFTSAGFVFLASIRRYLKLLTVSSRLA
jgi:transposase